MLVHSETKLNVSILCSLFTKYACIFQLKYIEYIKMTDWLVALLCVCLCVWQRSVATTTLCLPIYLLPLPTVWVCLRVCVVLICFSSSTTAKKKNMLLCIWVSTSISVSLLLLFFLCKKRISHFGQAMPGPSQASFTILAWMLMFVKLIAQNVQSLRLLFSPSHLLIRWAVVVVCVLKCMYTSTMFNMMYQHVQMKYISWNTFIVPLDVLAMSHADKPYLEAKRLLLLFFFVKSIILTLPSNV